MRGKDEKAVSTESGKGRLQGKRGKVYPWDMGLWWYFSA